MAEVVGPKYIFLTIFFGVEKKWPKMVQNGPKWLKTLFYRKIKIFGSPVEKKNFENF